MKRSLATDPQMLQELTMVLVKRLGGTATISPRDCSDLGDDEMLITFSAAGMSLAVTKKTSASRALARVA